MGADVERVAALRESLDRTVQLVEEAERRGAEGEASDEHRCVSVHLGPHSELVSLVVSETWHEHHPPDALGTVVRSTYAAARARRASAAAQSLDALLAEAPPPTRPLLPDGTSAAERIQQAVAAQEPGGVDSAALTTALGELLAEAALALDSAAGDAEQRRSTEHTATVGGAVTVRVDGAGRLVAVDYDERWLADASAFTISLETSEAITEARTAATESPVADGALADVARVVADPALLLQRLGLAG